MWYDWISDKIGLNALLRSAEAFTVLPEWLSTLEIIFAALCGYLLGSINSAIIVSGRLYGKDIRDYGSGNAGLTNMVRVFGKKAGILTFIGDVLKSALSVFLGAWFCGGSYTGSMDGAYLAGLFCVIGHIMPVYYKFRGGKGVLAAATMILLLDPLVLFCLLIAFVLVLLLTRYVSMGSVVAAFLYPALTYITHRYLTGSPPGIFKMLFCFVCGLLVIFAHRENIARVYHGKENRISLFGRGKKRADEDDEEER